MICRLGTNMSILLMLHLVSLWENNFIIYFLTPHYTECDVISRQNKKFKLKYLINIKQKYKRTCITVLNALSHHAIKIMSWALQLTCYNTQFTLVMIILLTSQ